MKNLHRSADGSDHISDRKQAEGNRLVIDEGHTHTHARTHTHTRALSLLLKLFR